MDDGPIQFPKNAEARARIERIREAEKRRAMPELLMLGVLWTVVILCIVPVGLLAFVGY